MPRHLFLDDYDIARIDGLTRRPHKAVRHPDNPLMVRDYPWEACRIQIYGRSVIYDPDAGKFRMYYIAQPHPVHYPWVKVNGEEKFGLVSLPAYAESQDGVHWTKPFLGQCTFDDCSDSNLIDVMRGQSFEPGVLHDPHDPDPSRRYKLFWWGQNSDSLFPPGMLGREYFGDDEFDSICTDEQGNVVGRHRVNMLNGDWFIDVAFSPDGIHWTRHPEPVMHAASDAGQSPLYDARIGKYVAFGRFYARRLTNGAVMDVGRAVGRVQSDDFIHWSDTELVLNPDINDPEYLQMNSMPTDIYEGLYIGMVETDIRPRQTGMQLACSRDGRHWTRVADRVEFLGLGAEGQWDSGRVRPGSALIPWGDKVLMYYCSGWPDSGGIDGVGQAYWRRDGFVSLSAGSEWGEVVTAPFIPEGPELHLNLDAKDGEATVEVVKSHSYNKTLLAEDQVSLPLRGDSTDVVVRWKSGNLASIVHLGHPISLRVKMKNADLYSFWSE